MKSVGHHHSLFRFWNHNQVWHFHPRRAQPPTETLCEKTKTVRETGPHEWGENLRYFHSKKEHWEVNELPLQERNSEKWVSRMMRYLDLKWIAREGNRSNARREGWWFLHLDVLTSEQVFRSWLEKLSTTVFILSRSARFSFSFFSFFFFLRCSKTNFLSFFNNFFVVFTTSSSPTTFFFFFLREKPLGRGAMESITSVITCPFFPCLLQIEQVAMGCVVFFWWNWDLKWVECWNPRKTKKWVVPWVRIWWKCVVTYVTGSLPNRRRRGGPVLAICCVLTWMNQTPRNGVGGGGV